VDGDILAPDEFGYFMILLAVAGNETTRNAISHGMLAFLDHPEQWELYREARPETAVDDLRSPNPQLGFGGTGTHYCLGVNLAKLEISLMFNAIADAMPGIRKNGEAERLRSGWLNGIKRLPVSYR
jgi:cholest-4-en-3-one 26-monooxygenase